MEYQEIHRHDPQLLALLAVAPIYRKHAIVQARPAMPGETVETVLPNGERETINVAREGDWIVTNPGREQYVINGVKFLARYAQSAQPGTYEAIGHCRAIQNPYGTPVSMLASWGRVTQGDADCMIADTCASDGTQLGGEPYLIERDIFHAEMSEIKNT